MMTTDTAVHISPKKLREASAFLPRLSRDIDLRGTVKDNLTRLVPRAMRNRMFRLYSGIIHVFWELVGRDGSSKARTKKFVIGAAVLVAITIIVGLAIGLQGQSDESRSSVDMKAMKGQSLKSLRPYGSTTGNITVDQFLSSEFLPSSFNATWLSDYELMYMDEERNVVITDVRAQTTRILLNAEIMAAYRLMDYRLSPDRKYMMLVHDAQKLYRYSYLARYTIYEFESGNTYPLEVTDSPEQDHLQLAIWSPIGNSIAFVFYNDIFYRASPASQTRRLTDTGIIEQKESPEPGPVYNGVADWVYEEEVLNTNKAMWFSPDGKKLAYATFNDSQVEHIEFPVYGPFIPENQYPHITSIPYPKPGTPNPLILLSVVELATEIIASLPPPRELAVGDYYFTAVAWANDESVTVTWLNRTQNLGFLYKYDAPKYGPKQIQRFTSPHGWLSLGTPPKFSPDGSSYLMILPVEVGDDSWPHIVRTDTNTGTGVPITTGKFTVKSIKHWDAENNVVYYRASAEGKTGERHIYKATKSKTECLSCGRENFNADDCLYNNAHFSKKASYVAMTCQGPYTVTKATVEETESGKEKYVWEENRDIQEKMDTIPEVKIMKTMIPVEGGFQARVNIMLPLDFDEQKKYPVIIYTYGGPNSQVGTEAWRGVDWPSVLASHGIGSIMIDGRGSGYMGNNLLFQINRKMGTVEVEDQIDVTAKLMQKYPWIDSKRVGIWGWSYGGYVTGRVLVTDTNNVFKCGISVAPVTSWFLYDSIYTERYMGLPYKNDNFAMYNKTDIIKHAEGLRHKKYYLIHGNADENVHYQQSMLLSKRLEHLDIMFRQQSYPDEGHGLSYVRRHLYHSMEHFWLECFDLA